MPELVRDCELSGGDTTTSYGAVSSTGFWSKHRDDVSYNQLQKVVVEFDVVLLFQMCLIGFNCLIVYLCVDLNDFMILWLFRMCVCVF